MKRQALMALALVGTIGAAGCASSPAEIRSLEPSAMMQLSKPPLEAAHCVASLMDERMQIARGHHIRQHNGGISVIGFVNGDTAWLVDIEPTEKGSIARFHIQADQFIGGLFGYVIHRSAMERDGLEILKECS